MLCKLTNNKAGRDYIPTIMRHLPLECKIIAVLMEGAQQVKSQLTDEQAAITNADGSIKINAVAGSGKTTTIIEYAAARPPGARILYLAFNKSVKLEAGHKFRERRLDNVRVETAHSLAFSYIVPHSGYTVRAQGYKTHEIVELLGLTGNGEKHAEYVVANHINKFITYFCNSDKHKVQELNYLDVVTDEKARTFVKTFYQYIEDKTRLLLAKMHKGEIEITHDFYLKKFQLSNPQLPYDYILFDEGQDASAAMLDVFMKQKAIKVIVGDVHQQIYAWRYAVNSLAKTDFNTLHLSASFRFPQAIADLAAAILTWKNHLYECTPVIITGKGVSTKQATKATLARTNLGLLLKAIKYVTGNSKVKHIYFEGNISSYTYADDGASLYDVLSLYNNKHDYIRDKLIKSMSNMADLEEYIEKTEDAQLSMMVDIVKEYGNEIPGIIKQLKDLHTGDEERHKAEMIFSTVHRAKGMEYDVVYLVDDFITEEKLEKQTTSNGEPINIIKLNEEINLLYVAVTRTKNILNIPEALMPKDFPGSPFIQVEKMQQETTGKAVTPGAAKTSAKVIQLIPKDKPYSASVIKNDRKAAHQPWTPALDNELKDMAEKGVSITGIAQHFGRSKSAIQLRLNKLNFQPE